MLGLRVTADCVPARTLHRRRRLCGGAPRFRRSPCGSPMRRPAPGTSRSSSGTTRAPRTPASPRMSTSSTPRSALARLTPTPRLASQPVRISSRPPGRGPQTRFRSSSGVPTATRNRRLMLTRWADLRWWRVLGRLLANIGRAGFVLGLALAGCARPERPIDRRDRPAAAAPDDARFIAGAFAYAKYCALCHGVNATGYAADYAPSLVSATFLESASDDFISKGIRDGRPGTAMAPYGRRAVGRSRTTRLPRSSSSCGARGPAASGCPRLRSSVMRRAVSRSTRRAARRAMAPAPIEASPSISRTRPSCRRRATPSSGTVRLFTEDPARRCRRSRERSTRRRWTMLWRPCGAGDAAPEAAGAEGAAPARRGRHQSEGQDAGLQASRRTLRGDRRREARAGRESVYGDPRRTGGLRLADDAHHRLGLGPVLHALEARHDAAGRDVDHRVLRLSPPRFGGWSSTSSESVGIATPRSSTKASSSGRAWLSGRERADRRRARARAAACASACEAGDAGDAVTRLPRLRLPSPLAERGAGEAKRQKRIKWRCAMSHPARTAPPRRARLRPRRRREPRPPSTSEVACRP